MSYLSRRRNALITGTKEADILPNGYKQLEKVWFQDKHLIGFYITISAPFDVEMRISLDVDNFANYGFTSEYKILAGLSTNFQLGVDPAGHPHNGLRTINRDITFPSMEPTVVEGIFRQNQNDCAYIIDGVNVGFHRPFGANNCELLGCVGYCYYLKITQNGTLIHDYVPCIRTSDNQAGVYDVCTDEFIFKCKFNRIMFYNK